MIAYLKGKIKHLGLNWIILDVSGVGYKIQLKIAPTLGKVEVPTETSGKIGDEADFYIYHHVREDRQELYGFKSFSEQQMFELLLSVSGVGPKSAFNILSKTNYKKLQEAIGRGDATLFKAISGVGKKMAMKIIIELKNKIIDGTLDMSEISGASRELVEAMESLGYKKQEIYPLLAKVPHDLVTTQEKITWILKNAGKKS